MLSQKLSERTISGLHEALIQVLPNIDCDTQILDIGCGTGAWLERLSNQGFKELYGIDLNITQCATSHADFSQVNLDQHDWELGDKKYGLITSIEVIEHLENPGCLFYHVAKHLDKNGFFLLTTPNIHSIHCRLKFLLTGKLASFDEKGDPTHIHPILMTCLNRILSRYSLEIIKQWGYPVKGSFIYRQSTSLPANFLELLLPGLTHGDTLCLLIQKKS